MDITVHSSIGQRRSSNQDYADYFYSQNQQVLLVLCDGVGGNLAGDVASRKTTEFIGRKFEQIDLEFDRKAMEEWLRMIIEEVNDYILAESNKDSDYGGMGTTLVLASIVNDEVIIAHVGDSRAYAYNEGNLEQLTEDHSLVNELIKSGEITPEEGLQHPRRNVVTQSIGSPSRPEPEINYLASDQIEILLLCSDGLSNMISDEEITQIIQEHKEIKKIGTVLIDAANHAGGLDNITIILVRNLTHADEKGGQA
ncbi:Stp1/IreP family PP2C-type Ser/Thr phosphatase [Facklamia sp. DSM 111018]|uniref:Stp1/IreP family PP2C-type Ser/Thr phosphatase n=1 Tax=Facklamia lactis TaxID=2749967 RepID=A0ABS0LN37_9LACT|nr:Stp1/IreP family PP2C-type Ser/Thr phosphatase [Facklamia lactis]MBG9979797.1 Stp1/IreP family PP2C-type Ser/Thr phosphatase [Facklamia lactis]MBG9985523.1 Stp1/IreP family PP2C-type Ser/Thr phosphatase [Facklamia lactis]